MCYCPAMEMCIRPAARLVSEVMSLGWVWDEITIPSATVPDKVYVVAYSPHGQGQSMCDCEGFEYRGYCNHIKLAREVINCEWTSNGAEVQQAEGLCPRCGSDTIEVGPRK